MRLERRFYEPFLSVPSSGSMKMKMLRCLLVAVLTWLSLAGYVDAAETITYVYTDAQGTPLANTDALGNPTKALDYRPYGTQALGGPPDGPGFAGHVNDVDTGLVYMQARFYDPEIGRFISVDPVSANSGDLFNSNRYAYADNSPTVFSDPDGRQAFVGWSDNQIHAASQPMSRVQIEALVGFTPVVGDAQAVVYAYRDPSAFNISVAAIGFIPLIGDIGKDVLKGSRVVKEITLLRSLHGEAAKHAADAIKAGKPSVLTIDRAGAKANRAAATGNLDKVPGKQLDEYPPAMFKEGGIDASVRAINPSDNMSAGACIGNACRGLSDGAQVKINVKD
jgi:RHS repeat-associated protein